MVRFLLSSRLGTLPIWKSCLMKTLHPCRGFSRTILRLCFASIAQKYLLNKYMVIGHS